MLEPKDLLIVNATVIAGLLILLTVQTTTENVPLSDWNEWQREITSLEAKHYALNQTLNVAYDKAMNSTSQERADEFQIHIDELSTRLMENAYLVEKMKQRDIRIIDKDGIEHTLDEWGEKPSAKKIMQSYSILMLFPFAISSAIILGASLENKDKSRRIERSIKLAKQMSAVGFLVILGSLAVINYYLL